MLPANARLVLILCALTHISLGARARRRRDPVHLFSLNAALSEFEIMPTPSRPT